MNYQSWLNAILAPGDVTCQSEDFFNNYNQKKEIAAQYAATADIVAEIGVRAGYSAHAFLSAIRPSAYVGYDTFEPYNEWRGGQDAASRILRRDFSSMEIHFVERDTQKMERCCLGSVELRDVDFFHVDGDHSHDGCTHDMVLAWESLKRGGVLVVDDYDMIPDIRMAVDGFIRNMEREISRWEYVKTFRGDMVIVKR
jgi:predicted O-methyltransferase YrrM